MSYASICKSTCSASTQTDLTWPADSKIPISTTVRNSMEAQTSTDDTLTLGAVGGNSTAKFVTNIPAPRHNSTPKAKIQLSNSKPGPASSKPGSGNKSSKGSNDPIKLYNKFGSLDHMDLEVNLSPKRGSGGRKNT